MFKKPFYGIYAGHRILITVMNKFILPFNCYFLLLLVAGQSIYSQSPYKISWKNDGWLIGGCAAAGIGALIVDRPASPLTLYEINRLSRSSIHWFDRSATYKYSTSASGASDLLAGLCLAAPLTLTFDEKIKSDFQIIALMYFETAMFAAVLPSYGKGIVERTRPFAYNPAVPVNEKTSPDARRSFFSRHTTLAFASAVFLSKVYDDYYPDSEWRPYVWTFSLLAASTVGYMRYESGSHFPSDILAGAVVGGVVGYIVPLLHRTDNDKFSVVPGLSGFQLRFAERIIE